MADSGDDSERQPDDMAPMTRAQVARTLGVSVSTVRRLEGSSLHPTTAANGTHLFEPAEVDRVAEELAKTDARAPTTEEGEIAAKVFTMLNNGHDLREIVVALRLPPRIVRDLYAEWRDDLYTGWRNERMTATAEKKAKAVRAQARADEQSRRSFEKTMAELAKLSRK